MIWRLDNEELGLVSHRPTLLERSACSLGRLHDRRQVGPASIGSQTVEPEGLSARARSNNAQTPEQIEAKATDAKSGSLERT